MKLTLGNPDTLAVSHPLALSHRGPNVPCNTMSNSTWPSYLARLLLDHMPDRTAGAGGGEGRGGAVEAGTRQKATVELICKVLETDRRTGSSLTGMRKSISHKKRATEIEKNDQISYSRHKLIFVTHTAAPKLTKRLSRQLHCATFDILCVICWLANFSAFVQQMGEV